MKIHANELLRSKEVEGSAEDIKLFKENQEKKLGIARLSNEELCDEESLTYKNYSADMQLELDQHVATVAKKNAAANQQGIDQLTKNRNAQLDIEKNISIRVNRKLTICLKRSARRHPEESDEQV